MAYTPLKLSIAEPCHEDWNDMQPVTGTTARHCGSCVKNVVDFTGFNDVLHIPPPRTNSTTKISVKLFGTRLKVDHDVVQVF